MSFKNILVVGGTGFIGYHLSKYLLKKKYKITSISTRKPKSIRRLNKVKYIKADISKIKELKFIKDEYDHIINLGGYVDHSNKKKTYESHYQGCVNLFKIFRKFKIKTFVQIGSSLEYGKISSPQKEYMKSKTFSVYAKSKLMATKYILKKFAVHSFPSVVVRGYQVYGPRQDNNRLISIVIFNCLKNKYFPCSSGEQSRDFLYIDDFVFAIYKVLNNKKAIGKIINIGYGKSTKVKNVILKIKNLIKKGTPIFNQIKLRKDESMNLFPSIKIAKQILKWRPRTNLDLGLKKTIKYYKQNLI